jgi:hypothetical protein
VHLAAVFLAADCPARDHRVKGALRAVASATTHKDSAPTR